jgi:hypothetical protein
MNLVLCFFIIVLLSVVCLRLLRDNSNLKTQLFNHKIRYDLESRDGNISEDYSMEVPPPIPRMLQ